MFNGSGNVALKNWENAAYPDHRCTQPNDLQKIEEFFMLFWLQKEENLIGFLCLQSSECALFGTNNFFHVGASIRALLINITYKSDTFTWFRKIAVNIDVYGVSKYGFWAYKD